MKFKVLSCLLAASAVLSVQGVILKNNTSQAITFSGFCTGDDISSDCRVLHQLKSKEKFDTAVELQTTIKRVTAHINGKERVFKGLNNESVITFYDKNEKIGYKKSGSFDNVEASVNAEVPVKSNRLIVVNNTSTVITLQHFFSKEYDDFRHQIIRNPVMLDSGDRIELSCRYEKIDRMNIADYILENLSKVKTLIVEEKNGVIRFDRQ